MAPLADLGLVLFDAGIAATALAGVVTVYMGFATFYDRPRRRQARDEELVGSERSAATVEIEALGSALASARFESAVLRELSAETRADRLFGRFLARIAPDATRDAAEIACEADGRLTPVCGRGDRARRLRSDVSSAAQTRPGAGRVWEFKSSEQPDGCYTLRSTRLGAFGSDEEGGPVVSRLFEAAVAAHRRLASADQTAEDLWFAEQRLELRQVTDGHPDKPAEMLEAFVADLSRRIGADRAALYLSPANGDGDFKPLARYGATSAPGIDRTARSNDLALATSTLYGPQVIPYVGSSLRSLGVVALDGAALAIGLRRAGRPLGAIVFSRVRPDAFGGRDVRLATWSATHLTDSISRVANRAAMVRMARRDGLTDLANRREFDEQLSAMIAAGRSVSLLLCDVDFFKRVNDNYGHLAGDEVLRVVAAVVQAEMLQTRATDEALAARYGGEEIALLLPGFGIPGATRVAESIRAAVERAEIVFEGQPIRVTTSVGVSATAKGVTADSLIGAADDALYRAKQSGRNRVCVAEDATSAAGTVATA